MAKKADNTHRTLTDQNESSLTRKHSTHLIVQTSLDPISTTMPHHLVYDEDAEKFAIPTLAPMAKCPCGGCTFESVWCPSSRSFAPLQTVHDWCVCLDGVWTPFFDQSVPKQIRYWEPEANCLRTAYDNILDDRTHTHPSFKPYRVTNSKGGVLRPWNGGHWVPRNLPENGYYPLSDRMTEWKHDLPVGALKLTALLKTNLNHIIADKFKPGGHASIRCKRKFAELGNDVSAENDWVDTNHQANMHQSDVSVNSIN